MTMIDGDPHSGLPVLHAGAPLGQAPATIVMLHGRGASPANILDLMPRLARPTLTYLAPTASDRSWYPFSFMSDVAKNEPRLSSALRAIGAVVDQAEAAGVPHSKIILLGFSQGACLSCEFAIRHGSRLGGVIAFSGGAIGAPGTEWHHRGHFDRMPVFLGCSDIDAHIPETRVSETAEVFTRMGADVTKRIYPGMGHLVNDDEVAYAQRLIDACIAG